MFHDCPSVGANTIGAFKAVVYYGTHSHPTSMVKENMKVKKFLIEHHTMKVCGELGGSNIHSLVRDGVFKMVL
jgi:hypothetical protein